MPGINVPYYDNKYVQYRLTSTSFSTNVTDWESCCEVLFLNGGGANLFNIEGYVDPSGNFISADPWHRTDFIPLVSHTDFVIRCCTNNEYLSAVAFFSDKNTDSYISSIKNVTGSADTPYTVQSSDIPERANYVVLSCDTSKISTSYISQEPSEDYSKSVIEAIVNSKRNALSIEGIDKQINNNLSFQWKNVKNYFPSGAPGTFVAVCNEYDDIISCRALYIRFNDVPSVDVSIILLNISTKEERVVGTILRSEIVAGDWKEYSLPNIVDVPIGYAIGLKVTSGSISIWFKYDSGVSNSGGSYILSGGSEYIHENNVCFAYDIVTDPKNNSLMALKNVGELDKRVTEIEKQKMKPFWNIPQKVYLSNTTQLYFYTNVLVHEHIAYNKMPFCIKMSDGKYISENGFDMLAFSQDAQLAFQMLLLSNGTDPYANMNNPLVYDSKTVDFYVKEKETAAKNVLVISDSFVDAGFDILTNILGFATGENVNINFIGTHLNDDGQYCEAYAGWNESDFLSAVASYQGQTISSPFVFNGKFDFQTYVNNLGQSIDKVIFLLGSNIPPSWESQVGLSIRKMIGSLTDANVQSSIRDVYPNIPIFVCLCMPYLSGCPNNPSIRESNNRGYYQELRMFFNKKYIEYFDNTDDQHLYVVPMLNFHPTYCYNGRMIEQVQFNEDNIPQIQTPDDIHPSATGSKCIAYNIYTYLKLAGM